MKHPLSVYLSGPMRGLPEFNFPLFHTIAAQARRDGLLVFSPAEHDEVVCRFVTGRRPSSFPGFLEGDWDLYGKATGSRLEDVLRWDTEAVVAADAIVMLPGWERSEGARLERLVGEALGKRVLVVLNVTVGPDSGWFFVADDVQRRMVACVETAA